MPVKAPRLCPCGYRIPSGERCACQVKADRERKARFDQTRPSSSQRGYTGRWEVEKAKWLAANKFCRICGQPANTVDHIKAHKGDKALFWDRTNWQSLCAPCHNGVKQRLERQAKRS